MAAAPSSAHAEVVVPPDWAAVTATTSSEPLREDDRAAADLHRVIHRRRAAELSPLEPLVGGAGEVALGPAVLNCRRRRLGLGRAAAGGRRVKREAPGNDGPRSRRDHLGVVCHRLPCRIATGQPADPEGKRGAGGGWERGRGTDSAIEEGERVGKDREREER
uniref:DUF834 domain-containing protein n=1 Tax=Oryza meridionalis TaxID=40149 RepID=A0A0E0C0W3_9ORYZ